MKDWFHEPSGIFPITRGPDAVCIYAFIGIEFLNGFALVSGLLHKEMRYAV